MKTNGSNLPQRVAGNIHNTGEGNILGKIDCRDRLDGWKDVREGDEGNTKSKYTSFRSRENAGN